MKERKQTQQECAMNWQWKHIRAWGLVALAGVLVGCGPADLDFSDNRDRGLEPHRSARVPFGTGAEYRFVSYEVLHSTLTDVLGVSASPYPGSDSEPASPFNPLRDPVSYLEVNRVAAGAPVFHPNPDLGSPGVFTAGGMKAWTLASNGACAIAMEDPGRRQQFFPGGTQSYDVIIRHFLGRAATEDDARILDGLTGQFNGESARAAAVCTALLNSLEFLTLN
jgi:hypothetical protein